LLRLYSKRNVGYRLDPMLELTITSFHLIQVLVVGSEVQLSTPLTKGKG
jgi:hypothetical protein